jgi:gliding motility-associated-like protein
MKNYILKYLSIIIICILGYSDVKATHIVGGDITYKHVGGNFYEIVLTLRRDCEEGNFAFDRQASLGLFDAKTNVLINDFRLDFMASDTVGNTIVANCGFVGGSVCVQRTSYRKIINLEPREGGYIIAYQRCCRNGTLFNVIDPLDSGSTQWVHITEEALALRNSSPTFTNWPDVYICANTPLIFNHSATDADGDLLVYRTCVPSDGATKSAPDPAPPGAPPYFPIQWKPPYNLENMMGGTPLAIDPQTGVITANPNLVGQFLIGICVDEYRNGVLISTIKRDFQYNVRICLEPAFADFETQLEPCKSTPVTFKNNTLNAVGFEWNFNFPSTDMAFKSTEESPTFNYTGPGTYIIRLAAKSTNGACDGIAFDTIVIPEPPLPLAIVSGATNTCGEVATYAAAGGYTNGTIQWSTDPDFTNIIGTGSSVEFAIGAQKEAVLYVRSFENLDCGALSSMITIINRSFSLSYDQNLSMCKSEQKSVVFSPDTDDNIIYNITDPHVISIVGNTLLIQTLPTDSQPFTIVGTASNGFGCTRPISISVEVSSTVGSQFVSNLKSCDLLSMCFTINDPFNLGGIIWDFGVPGDIDTSSSINPCFNYPEGGSYTVTLSSTATSCPFAPIIKTIEVPDRSIAPMISNQLKDCNTREYCFNYEGGNILGDVTWNFGDPNSGNSNISSLVSPCHKFSAPGQYTVTLTNTNTLCPFAPLTMIIKVEPPVVAFQFPEITVCNGSNFVLTANPIPGLMFSWCDKNGVVVSTDISLEIITSENTFYTLKVKNDAGCTDSSRFDVKVFKFDYNIESPSVICLGENYLVKVLIDNPAQYDFSWGPVECILNGINSQQALVSAAADKEITIQITNKITGCVDFRKISTKVNPAAAASFSGNYCNGQSSVMNAIVANPSNYDFAWTPVDMIVSGANTPNPIVNLTSDQQFTLILTDKGTKCETVFNYTAVVNPLLNVQFENPNVEIKQGLGGELKILNPIPNSNYLWSDGQNGTEIQVGPLFENTSYTVTVTDVNGCKGTGTINVVVRTVNCTENDEYLPNAFSPNGDGKNDILLVKSNLLNQMELVIYNRWGREMFSSTDTNKGWDGTCEGKDLKPDVYAYYLKGTCVSGDTFIQKGNVSLIR